MKCIGQKNGNSGTKTSTICKRNITDNNKTTSENNEKDKNEDTNDRTVRRKTYIQALCTGSNDTKKRRCFSN